LWKRKHFEEAGSGSKLESDQLYAELEALEYFLLYAKLEAEAKIFYCIHISGLNIIIIFNCLEMI